MVRRPAGLSQSKYTNSIIRRGILDQKRDMSSFGDLCTSPGHFALFEAIRFKRHRQVLLLTEAGIDVDCRNGRGLTPLIHAILNVDDDRSRSKLVRLLLEAGANPNLVDWDGYTALMYASLYGYADTVKLLLEQKETKVAMRDPDGNTAFMLAAAAGHASVISTFIAKFRDDMTPLRLNSENSQGMTALQLASGSGNEECARILTREAQIFPKAISGFPDPRILEREPTPLGVGLMGGGDLSHIDDYSPSKVFDDSPTKDVGINTVCLQNDFLLAGERTANTFPEDSENIPDACIPSTPPDEPEISREELPSSNYAECVSRTLRNRATQTPMKWLQAARPKTSKRTKVLDPINNVDGFVKGNPKNQAVEREAERGRLPEPMMFPRPSGSFLGSLKEQTAKNTDQKRIFWQPVAIGNGKNAKLRPESEPSILPIIPCTSPLPPVRKALVSSDSQKCAMQLKNTMYFVGEKPNREQHLFKSNVAVNSS